jgi:hypothetical protein
VPAQSGPRSSPTCVEVQGSTENEHQAYNTSAAEGIRVGSRPAACAPSPGRCLAWLGCRQRDPGHAWVPGRTQNAKTQSEPERANQGQQRNRAGTECHRAGRASNCHGPYLRSQGVHSGPSWTAARLDLHTAGLQPSERGGRPQQPRKTKTAPPRRGKRSRRSGPPPCSTRNHPQRGSAS